jgi:hypothetical protein
MTWTDCLTFTIKGAACTKGIKRLLKAIKMTDQFLIAGKGLDLVIHTRAPYELGRIAFYKSIPAMHFDLKHKKPLAFSFVPGYSIAVIWNKTLEGSRLKITKDTTENLQRLFDQMSDFFLNEIILTNEQHYNQYRDSLPG